MYSIKGQVSLTAPQLPIQLHLGRRTKFKVCDATSSHGLCPSAGCRLNVLSSFSIKDKAAYNMYTYSFCIYHIQIFHVQI